MEESEFNRVKERITGMGFSFTRVSEKTKKEIKEYARKDFANDRGAALTHVWKFFKGECSSGHEEITAKMDILADQIQNLTIKNEEIETQFKTIIEAINKSGEKPKKTRLSGELPSEKKKQALE